MPPPPAPDLLLCERCGYALRGLDPAAACPECGLSAHLSLPTCRTGSPWQQAPSATSLLATWAALLRAPQALFRRIRINDLNDHPLLVDQACLGVPMILAATFGAIYSRFPVGRNSNPLSAASEYGVMLVAATLTATLWPPLVLFLSALERRGLRFFGARRGWRITRPVAASVVAHAALGWVLAAALTAAGLLAVALNLHPRPALVFALWPIPDALLPPAAGFLLGMLAFELLVYLGIRQCRHTNPPGAH